MSCKFSQIVNFITIKNIIYQGDPHVHSLTYFTLEANVHGKPKYNQKVTLVSQKSEQGVISHNSPMPPSPLQEFIRLTKLTVLPNYLLLKNFYPPSPSTILIFVSIVLVMALHARLNILLNTLLLLVSEVKLLSHVRLFATPWTVAHQAPPSMGSSRQERWSGVPFTSIFL